MYPSFSVGRWTLMTFFGWLIGLVLIFFLSEIVDTFGIHESMFSVGTGLTTGVCALQWLYLRKCYPLSIGWMFSGTICMTISFIVIPLFFPNQFEYHLVAATATGSICCGFFQFLQLQKHFSNGWIWIPVTFLGWMASVGLIWLINHNTVYYTGVIIRLNFMLIAGGGAIIGIIQGIAWKWIQKTTYPKRQSTF